MMMMIIIPATTNMNIIVIGIITKSSTPTNIKSNQQFQIEIEKKGRMIIEKL